MLRTKKFSMLEKTITSVAIGVLALLPMPSFASVIGSFKTEFNTDWTVAGYGKMRGVGSGSITVNGVSGSVNKAYFIGMVRQTQAIQMPTLMLNSMALILQG